MIARLKFAQAEGAPPQVNWDSLQVLLGKLIKERGLSIVAFAYVMLLLPQSLLLLRKLLLLWLKQLDQPLHQKERRKW